MKSVLYILSALVLCHMMHNVHEDCSEHLKADHMACGQISEASVTFMKPLCGYSGVLTCSLSSGRVSQVGYKKSVHDQHASRNARDKHFTPKMSCYYTSSIAKFPSGTTEFSHHLISLGKLVL